jgi:transcriptional regulator with XRE-family HTH domain
MARFFRGHERRRASVQSETALSIARAVGQITRRIRVRFGWPQARLARELGVSLASASKIENGRQSLTVNQLWELASVLRVDASELVELIEKERHKP